MAYNYNNYFNNCGVNCGDYGDHSNSGYNDHSNYFYSNCHDSGYGNHSNSGSSHSNSSGSHSDYSAVYSDNSVHYFYSHGDSSSHSNYSDHDDYGCSDHNNNSCYQYVNSGYDNHTNDPTGHHINHFNDGKSATTMIYSISGIDAYSTNDWVKLGDAIDDLKKLRNAIADMPNNKLDSEGKDFTMSLPSGANSDDKFAAGQTPKAAQFNETRSNIKTLWKKIWGSDGSGWPAEVKHGDKMKKDDYQKLFNKVDSLARLDQSRFYSNHYNSSKGGQNNGQ